MLEAYGATKPQRSRITIVKKTSRRTEIKYNPHSALKISRILKIFKKKQKTGRMTKEFVKVAAIVT